MQRWILTLLATIMPTILMGEEPPGADTEPTMVLVELFTSEGCSSCPPADDLLARLIKESPERSLVVPVGFHVDYWNNLGWNDPFSSPEFTKRQYGYADSFGGERVYTPQMIVDGLHEFLGSDAATAVRVIHQAAAKPKPRITCEVKQIDGQLRVSLAIPPLSPGDDETVAELWMVVTESKLSSEVERGGNAGKKLLHFAVARRFTPLADIDLPLHQPREEKLTLDLPSDWKPTDLKIVVVAQALTTRQVLAIGRADVMKP